MFFVFHCGSTNCGEASGGLGDLDLKTESRDEAIARAREIFAKEPWFNTQILDGKTGEVFDIEDDGTLTQAI